MNILFLSSGAHTPAARFRILAYQRHFLAEGHNVVLANSFPQKYDYFPWMGFRPSQLLKRSVRWWHWLRTKLQRFDIVFIDREIFDNNTTDMERRFRESCGRLVIDLDDAIFLRYPDKFDHLMQLADMVICGNHFLEDKVRPLNSNICHVPTCVDLDEYTARPSGSETNSIPVIGWMGTSGNVKYLSVVAEALRIFASEAQFELRVVVPEISALSEMNLAGVNVVHEPWQPEREVEQLQQFDIGLMPLFPNEEWDIYKCGLKLIQYMAVGVPGIAAPVGVNSEILDNNQNGKAAQTTEEWLTALRYLCTNPEIRRQMGLRGRKTVAQKYSIQANYPVLRDALQSLLPDPGRISG
jgi:glycosyltransferase involved in cell wall biosynthesis